MKYIKRTAFILFSTLIFMGNALAQTETFFASPDSLRNNYFGYDVAMNENYAVVGSVTNSNDLFLDDPHPVYVFKKNEEGQWEIDTPLISSDYAVLENFGYDVAISDDNVIIIANISHQGEGIYDNGVVYVFELINEEWAETAIIQDPHISDELGGFFGHKIAIDGDYIMVSDINYANLTTQQSGIAYIFHKEGNEWVLQSELVSNLPSIKNTFGQFIAIKGDYAMVTTHSAFDNTDFFGKVDVYKRSGDTWNLETIIEEEENSALLYAASLAMDDSVAVIGASLFNGSEVPSYVEILNLTENGWERGQKIIAADIGNDGAFYAFDVAVEDNLLLVASPFTDTGSVFIYENMDEEWLFKQEVLPSNGKEGISFASSVSLSETDMCIGAFNWRDTILLSNGTLSEESIGAVYFYQLDDEVPTKNVAPSIPSLTISPNPVGDILHLKIDKQILSSSQLNIYNSIGQLVIHKELPKGEKNVNISVALLDAGVYFCEIKQHKQTFSTTFFKQ